MAFTFLAGLRIGLGPQQVTNIPCHVADCRDRAVVDDIGKNRQEQFAPDGLVAAFHRREPMSHDEKEDGKKRQDQEYDNFVRGSCQNIFHDFLLL